MGVAINYVHECILEIQGGVRSALRYPRDFEKPQRKPHEKPIFLLSFSAAAKHKRARGRTRSNGGTNFETSTHVS